MQTFSKTKEDHQGNYVLGILSLQLVELWSVIVNLLSRGSGMIPLGVISFIQYIVKISNIKKEAYFLLFLQEKHGEQEYYHQQLQQINNQSLRSRTEELIQYISNNTLFATVTPQCLEYTLLLEDNHHEHLPK